MTERARLGIAIMAYTRPDYLRRTLDSLAANDLSDCDVHLWQDGALGGDDLPGVEASLRVWEAAALPSKTLHWAERNLCCAAQRYRLMPWMAEHYERFICMDNDVLLGRWAIRHMRTLFEQYEGAPGIGSISPAFKLECPKGQQDAYRDKCRRLRGHFWCEGWWRETWAQVWPWYERYYELVRDVDYRSVGLHAGGRVADWNRSLGLDGYTEGPSSDTALARGLIMAGLGRLRLCVNRATGIGERGLHSYPDLFLELGAGNQPIYEWPDEETITRFELVEGGR